MATPSKKKMKQARSNEESDTDKKIATEKKKVTSAEINSTPFIEEATTTVLKTRSRKIPPVLLREQDTDGSYVLNEKKVATINASHMEEGIKMHSNAEENFSVATGTLQHMKIVYPKFLRRRVVIKGVLEYITEE